MTFNEQMRIQEQSQRDQIGYITDYISKKQPLAIKEVDKFVEGHKKLQESLAGESLEKAAVRHTQRLLSDFYGRATVRKAVETTNLLACRLDHDVTAAESLKSHLLVAFPCSDYMRLMQQQKNCEVEHEHFQGYEVDKRNPNQKTYVPKLKAPEFYGYRGRHQEVEALAAYEFHELWQPMRVSYPTNVTAKSPQTYDLDGQVVIKNNEHIYHAVLTQQGQAQLQTDPKGAVLKPGEDYVVRAESGVQRDRDWIAYPRSSPLRNDWVMVRRASPAIPRFDGQVLDHSGCADDHAMRMSLYFRPWTLLGSSECALHINDLCDVSLGWSKSWNKWLQDGVYSMHSKHIIQNFMSTFSNRDLDGNDDDVAGKDTSKLQVNLKNLDAALTTKRRLNLSDTDTSFEFVNDNWGGVDGSKSGERNDRSMPSNIDDALKAAAVSQKNKPENKDTASNDSTADVAVTVHSFDVRSAVLSWVREMKSNEIGGFTCKNSQQEAVVDLIADRVLEEHADKCDNHVGESEPVRALITGGPGVGKSFVIKAARNLFDKLGYSHGIEYAFTGLQAVVAAQLNGQTLHSLLGLNMFGKPSDSQESISKVADTLGGMRWIVIDEISQVTCKLLAQCEEQTRAMVQDVQTYRLDKNKKVRAWAGINILYVGDFLQLPPPGPGACLTTIPDNVMMRLTPKASEVTQALNLLWHDTNNVIELVEQIRCVDPWWNDVLQEFRIGQLSQNTHAYLHGRATDTPGTWRTGNGVDWGSSTDEYRGCRQAKCKDLIGASWDIVKQRECKECKLERQRRTRVAAHKDKRLKADNFKAAIAIVANNDLKHQICKVRAAKFARDSGQRIVWAPAQDTAKSDSLCSDPNLLQRKEQWLQYHNKKCGNLWGMVPLVKGMRVSLVDHLDRSEKCLLRGSCGKQLVACLNRFNPVWHAGELVGWVLHPFEKKQPSKGTVVLEYSPIALLVKFDGADWVLGDLDPGVYPVKPQKKDWYVDSDSPKPKNKVSREQVGVGPDYARTAYSTQGLTLDAALVDLCFSDETNPTTAYVALSRVRGANDVLIIQEFGIEPFQQGIPVGPKWLLKTLRGEDLSADITAYDEALRLQREAEVAARESTKAAKDSVRKTTRLIKKNKRRADKGRSSGVF